MSRAQLSLSLIIGSMLLACFGPVEPAHPLDEDTAVNAQARASLSLEISTPVLEELSGYVSLSASHAPDDLRRLYLEDFTFKGNVTYSDGESRQLYSHTERELSPGVYALHSFVPHLQLKEPHLFELGPGGELSLDLTFELTP